MRDAYSLFRLQPIHVHGKGEVAPEGYVSDAQRELMEAASRACGDQSGVMEHPMKFMGSSASTDTPPDPWGDLH